STSGRSAPTASREERAMTPTSATGADRRAARAGLSLVEVLVVLALAGLAASAVVMTLPSGRGGAADEAEVFAARLARAREEAILTNRIIEAEADAEGWRFQTVRAGRR